MCAENKNYYLDILEKNMEKVDNFQNLQKSVNPNRKSNLNDPTEHSFKTISSQETSNKNNINKDNGKESMS